MIRLRHISAVLLLSLLVQQQAVAQEDVPSQEDDGPGQTEGPSDSPSLPGGPKLGKNPGAKGATAAPGAKTGPEGPGGAEKVPEGQELVSIDFPEPTEIKDIIRAVALWTGKNVIIGKNVSGKIQMISPRKVTKEEAYQAFLSALNVAGYTTVETGKVIKIVATTTAAKDNLSIYQGTNWSPRTDKLITQIVPLRYIEARVVQTTLSQLVPSNSIIAYQPTNTLIISDTGYRVRRVLKIIEMLDVAGQQPKVALIPIRYGDAKTISAKISEIISANETANRAGAAGGGSGKASFKVSVDERSNSVVIFGPPRTIQDVKDLVKKFDFPIDDPANQAAIRVRFLDYADAKKIATTLSSLASGQGGAARRSPSSPIRTLGQNTARTPRAGEAGDPSPVADLGDNVKITADDSSNSLLITGSRSAYEAVNGIIRKLDRRRPQVYVEADILDVNLANNFNFGTSLLLGNKTGETVQAYGWQGTKVAPIIVGGSNTTNTDSTKLEVAKALGTDFTIGVLSGKAIDIPGIGAVRPAGLISMLKADSNTRVLSSPHLLTSNNEVAKIVVGDTIFYKTAVTSAAIGAGAIEKVEKENADLSLEIKPNISHAGNYVTLKVDLEANEGGLDTTTGVPKINKRQTSQLVTVKNGQTVVVSGLVKRRETEAFQKIPLLGDIPLLGWLFRNSSITKENTSLMIFLTPHVVYGANDLAAIYDKKVAERDEMMANAFGSDSDDDFVKAMPSKADGQYKPDEIDALEEKDQEDLRRQMREDRGMVQPQAAAPVNAAGAGAGAEGSKDANGKDKKAGTPGHEEGTTVPMPMNGFEDGGNPVGGMPTDGSGMENNIPPSPPPPSSEPMEIPEPMMDQPPME
ncbi:MAG: type II secretion system secretin GspD [Oligoflexus sp.]|nr:type II secretion system secretin GspD [Oligoflexus sp.]